MELYVDIANVDDVKRVMQFYPIDGVTTNPNILAKSDCDVTALMRDYKMLADARNLTLFFQVTAETADGMLSQARALYAYFDKRLVVKLPAQEEGYAAIPLLKQEGIPVAVTMVHSMMQALVAAKAGADYVAPYITHIDNIGADGVGTVAHIVRCFQQYGYPCKVLGASFRTVDQIGQLALVGCHAVTITPAFFHQLILHPSTNESAAQFKAAWESRFGQKGIEAFVPER